MRFAVTAALCAGLVLSAGCDWLPIGRHHASLRGIKMVYYIRGHGPPLLLLHGGGGRALGLARQIHDLRKHFKVIAPDSRSHGDTTDPGDTLDYHVMAEDMVALLDHLRIGRADVMGWSDGGIVGLDLAIHHPDRVRKLVVFGANATPDGIEAGQLAEIRQDWAEDSTQAAADSTQGLSQRLSLSARLRHLWLTQPDFGPAELGRIHAPTLVAVGDHDWPSLDHTLALARAIHGAQLCVIPGATHSVLRERPDIADEIVSQFLRAPMPVGRPPG